MKKTKKAEEYSLVLKINDTEYKAEGATIIEALNKLPKFLIKSRGFFTIKKGNFKAEKLEQPFRVRMILNNKYAAQLFEKRMNLFMKING